ncbi:MAG: citrate/2-methylcitrate synthase, partial [Butyricicoccus sp.]
MNSMLTVTPAVEDLAALCRKNSDIPGSLYQQYDVKRGLRDVDGHGVVAGLTNISEIVSRKIVDGKEQSCPGELYYRGYSINELVRGFIRENRMGFEETTYLLLFGELPSHDELVCFEKLLASSRTLPTNFVRDVVMKASTHDLMNTLSRSVLTLASYDERCDDISLPNVLRQCLMLISVFPMLAAYSYHAYNHYECGGSMYIHYPSANLSTAGNILRILRADMRYTPLEERVLDLALVLHMEHGGGNNSSFTT